MPPTSPGQVLGGSVSSEIGSPDTQSVSSFMHSTSVMVLSDTANLSEEEPEEVITFEAQPNEPGRMPNSSYKTEDTLFTWTDITGVYANCQNTVRVVMFLKSWWSDRS